MKSIGAWLMIIFGTVLVVGGLGESTVTVGGVRTCGGGGVGPVGSQAVCDIGSIQVTKTVVGDSPPPPGGWDVTISSINCSDGLVGRDDLTANISAAGGVANFSELFVSTDITNETLCEYSLIEAPVTDWTPTFVPAGPTYTVVNGQTLGIALTNTSPMATTTTEMATTTTSTIAATTTTGASDTTLAPTTTVIATTTSAVAAVPPTPPAKTPLPETGSRSTAPITYVGGALILLGGLILLSRRRTRLTASD